MAKKQTFYINVETPQGYDNFKADPITIVEGLETEDNENKAKMINMILAPSSDVAYLRFEVKGKLRILPGAVAKECIFNVEQGEVKDK